MSHPCHRPVGRFLGGEYMLTFARPLLYHVHNRNWAIDLVEHFRTCCDRKKNRWPSKWCGWGPCYWCGWWEWKPLIVERIGHPLCEWCYKWHHSDYTDNRPYRPHLVERTTCRRSASNLFAEDLVYMWERSELVTHGVTG